MARKNGKRRNPHDVRGPKSISRGHMRSNGRGPSVKAIETTFRYWFEHGGHDPTAAAKAIKAKMDEGRGAMSLANKLLGGSGIEALGVNEDGPKYDYVNMGDTYTQTILFDRVNRTYKIGSWGDVVERHERRPHGGRGGNYRLLEERENPRRRKKNGMGRGEGEVMGKTYTVVIRSKSTGKVLQTSSGWSDELAASEWARLTLAGWGVTGKNYTATVKAARPAKAKRKPNGGKVARPLTERQEQEAERLWFSVARSRKLVDLIDKAGVRSSEVVNVIILLAGNDANHLAAEFCSAFKSRAKMRTFYIDDRALKSFRPIRRGTLKITSAQVARTINKLKAAAR